MARLKFGGRAARPLRPLQAQYPDAVVTKTGRDHWQFAFPNGRSTILPGTFFAMARWSALCKLS